MAADRRRINGPPSGTAPPFFAFNTASTDSQRPKRTRKANELRKLYLETGVTPAASGSSYLEIQPSNTTSSKPTTFLPALPSLKISVAVHGPKPLPRSAPFSPNLVLSTNVKFAPFATRHRRGYLRDTSERDLGVHLENALRGVIIGDRWPKSGLDVIVTILEGEEDRWCGDEAVGSGTGAISSGEGWGLMNVLAACVTASSAAIVDAKIDCLDLVLGGVAAVVPASIDKKENLIQGMEVDDDGGKEKQILVLDPCPSEHTKITALCVLGYMPSRDEVTEVWLKGDVPCVSDSKDDVDLDSLMEGATLAARGSQTVLIDAIRKTAEAQAAASQMVQSSFAAATAQGDDVVMT